MEASVGEEMKYFDETAAFIYGFVSSTLFPGLPKELCEVDSKEWFVKTRATSPLKYTLDVNQNPGLLLEFEQSQKMFIKTEVTSPSKDSQHVEELSISPPACLLLEFEPSQKMFIKTRSYCSFQGFSICRGTFNKSIRCGQISRDKK